MVLCDTYLPNGEPHATNHRAGAVEIFDKKIEEEPWFGLEQEYFLIDLKTGKPLGCEYSIPAQGPFYCGVGGGNALGRDVVEDHLEKCLYAGLKISGINTEVAPGQWEFQIGPAGSLAVGDHLLVARWLLYRIAEDDGVNAKLDPKPVTGDWNGAGMHTNFSTKAMRADGGIKAIEAACEKLRGRAALHIENYGAGIEQRLTGKHETASYKEFTYGVGNRGASVRIPLHVSQAGKGYLEDRRPCANADPYVVVRLLLETVCG